MIDRREASVTTDVRTAEPAQSRRRSPVIRRARATRRRGPQRELRTFLASAVLVLLAVSAATIWVSREIARANALADAERIAVRLTDGLVAPVLRQAIAGEPGQWEQLDRDVRTRMNDGSITSVDIWTADGTVLYSTEGQLAGTVIKPTPQLRAAIRGEVVSDIDDDPETATDGPPPEPELEVYVPLSIDGTPLAVETYLSSAVIDRQAALLREVIIPLIIGALIALQLIQVPIAVSLSRRVRRQDAERAQLMKRHLAASDRERRTVAADIHDGPVQELAGVGYALSALRPSVPPERQSTLDHLSVAVRRAVQSLRRLMVDVYPPDLSGPGLGDAIATMTHPLAEQGVDVSIDCTPLPQVSSDVAAVLYRTAKEAVTNVDRHAQAGRLWVTLEATELDGQPAVRLEVADDGVGFLPDAVNRRKQGHLGLQLLRDRVIDLGGTVELGSRLDGGAVVTAVVPAQGR